MCHTQNEFVRLPSASVRRARRIIPPSDLPLTLLFGISSYGRILNCSLFILVIGLASLVYLLQMYVG